MENGLHPGELLGNGTAVKNAPALESDLILPRLTPRCQMEARHNPSASQMKNQN